MKKYDDLLDVIQQNEWDAADVLRIFCSAEDVTEADLRDEAWLAAYRVTPLWQRMLFLKLIVKTRRELIGDYGIDGLFGAGLWIKEIMRKAGMPL